MGTFASIAFLPMSFRKPGKTEDTGESPRTCAQRASVHMRNCATQTHSNCTHATVHAARPFAAEMRQRPLGTHNLAHGVGGFLDASRYALGILVLTLPSGLCGMKAPRGRAKAQPNTDELGSAAFVTPRLWYTVPPGEAMQHHCPRWAG